MTPPPWQPAASWETLNLRAELLHSAREFFRQSGYLEVQTPLLSRESIIDSQLDPIPAAYHTHRGSRGETWYLQTSPEFAMKRLLADLHSSPDTSAPRGLVHIASAFRDGEAGRLHNPEFTLIEWYRIGDTHYDQMEVTESFVRHLTTQLLELKPDISSEIPRVNLAARKFAVLSYDEACERSLGCRVLSRSSRELVGLCRTHGIEPPASLDPDDRDALLNLLLAEKVEPTLGHEHPEFLFDYPASQASLARVRNDDPPVAERFELYWDGVEICNGYHELTSVKQLKSRMQKEAEKRKKDHATVIPEGKHFLAAMDAGLPACSGVALGFDRLLMLLAGKDSLAEVMTFPHDRA